MIVGDFETFHAEFRSFSVKMQRLEQSFSCRVEGKARCPWIFSVKMHAPR
ncbi:hypothetical protein B4114_3109 [Geobacillus stearothermophilus]|uniref:Uncharacterized protein n=1 Tax=Geobacillus stearothermophilus TaxID=1422 RepID=A0A150N8S5_GEOSE|nr:hypothetical protein B4114_3109 [Geobacillus stearothermophilus]